VIEIDRTLSTWPQLASDVVLGASALAEGVRRIGLGEELRSGRTRIDIAWALNQLDEPDMTRHHPPPVDRPETPQLPGIPGIIAAAAIRAPSGGNVQPWYVQAGPADITIDIAAQHTSTMDVEFRASAVAVGAALLNARIAAAAHHALGPATLTDHVGGSPLRASLKLSDGADPTLADLYQPMLARSTNRHHGEPQPIDTTAIEALTAAAQREGARLCMITDRDDIAHAATLLAASDRTRYLTPHLHQEMVSELRWPGDADPDTGIEVRSLELDAGELALLEILRRPDVMAHLAQWDAGSALGEDTRDRILASSALAVVSVSGQDLRDYAKGGAAVELVWIIAQQQGLSVQPVSPVFLYAHSRADFDKLSPRFADQLTQLQSDFRGLAGIPSEDSIVLVLRLTVGPPASVPSRRSPDRARVLN
jgi:hypothetical protein